MIHTKNLGVKGLTLTLGAKIINTGIKSIDNYSVSCSNSPGL